MLLHVPGPLVLPLPWDGGRPQESIWAEIKFFVDKSLDYFSLFRPHASNLFSYPYNVAMWTIPLELKGSLLVFGLVFVLKLITPPHGWNSILGRRASDGCNRGCCGR